MTIRALKRAGIHVAVLIALISGLPAVSAYADEPEGEGLILAQASLYQEGSFEFTEPEPEMGVMTMSVNTVEEAIYEALRTRQPAINIWAFGVSQANLVAVYSDVINNHPELFYVASRFYYEAAPWNSIVITIWPTYDERYGDAEIALFNTKVSEILSRTIEPGMTDEEMALSLHDYIVLNCEYDTKYERYNAYNALIERSAVCQGYMLAYNMLLNCVGIETKPVPSDRMNHIWTLANIDGSWYHIDPTWDDPLWGIPADDISGVVEHDYFLVSDSTLGKDHYDWPVSVPACTSTRFEDSSLPYVGSNAPFIYYDGYFYTISSARLARVGFYGENLEYLSEPEQGLSCLQRYGDRLYSIGPSSDRALSYGLETGDLITHSITAGGSSLKIADGILWWGDTTNAVQTGSLNVRDEGGLAAYNLIQTDLSGKLAGGGATRERIALQNTSGATESRTVIAAYYNADGKLLQSKCAEVSLSPGQTTVLSFDLPGNYSRMSLLLLDDGLRPLTAVDRAA